MSTSDIFSFWNGFSVDKKANDSSLSELKDIVKSSIIKGNFGEYQSL
ncbi:hypothetical protein A3Q56_03500 [Intoshia linei]|uniref:Uncharacterized protein n=1 Tax=Intoshia linei TaxID=1819745 RepID=A0A177B5Q9_9BILA|nr:hypothetical protein A3Q56_03500 [Intoshia linei]